MVGVFAIFATLSQVSIKQAGVGLGVAVLVDATIVRTVLLPAAMSMLGERNWYLPRWLQWLPRMRSDDVTALPDDAALDRARRLRPLAGANVYSE
jgi:RND superfamily putative drug exporter